MQEKSFSVQVLTYSPIVIGSLSALLDMLMRDVEKGSKIDVSYYRNRVEELREDFPNLLPSKEITIINN